ncbi:SGNH/GDSL hydrolase family protein [Siculibacillus lacustris]|nr:SGNH/GDSL hydrolase family protein [Siculibacillus lacustris]
MRAGRRWRTAIALALAAGLLTAPLRAEPPVETVGTPVPPECLAPGVEASSTVPLPFVAAALKSRNRIVVLAIGGSAIGGRPYGSRDYASVVEAFLERSFKGLDVQIVQRGVSGELGRDVAARIRLEVARSRPDVVFWQVGTADALAGVDPEELAATVRDTIRWLRDHEVDTVLIGLQYVRVLREDPQYQATREALAEVAKAEGVLRIRRYEVVETINRLQKPQEVPASDAELTAAGYNCMAEYLARAVGSGLFGRKESEPPPLPPKAPPPP